MRSRPEFRGLGQYLAMGLQMVVVTLVGAGIGWWLDGRTGRGPLFLCIFFVLGALGGIAAVWRALHGGGSGPNRRE